MVTPVPVAAATANPKKLREIEELFAAVASGRFELLPRPADLPDVVEDGATLAANAELKARAVMEATGLATIADDTGLEVDALNGAPGVRSARFAGDGHNDDANVALLLSKLADTAAADRSARFRTVICIARPDGEVRFVDGVCEGQIAMSVVGDGGFGYDPVFVPTDGDGRTFAEMSAEEKHTISHRGRAMRAAATAMAEFLLVGSGGAEG